MRTLYIFCVALIMAAGTAFVCDAFAHDEVNATPAEVMKFREAPPSRTPAAVTLPNKNEKPASSARLDSARASYMNKPFDPEANDDQTFGNWCVECLIVSQPRSPSLSEQGKDIQKVLEAALRSSK